MTVVETLLVYVGVPALAYAVLALLVYGGGGGRKARYRPGRGWDHEDVWYLPRPVTGSGPAHPALELTGTDSRAGAHSAAQGHFRTARGGASGTW